MNKQKRIQVFLFLLLVIAVGCTVFARYAGSKEPYEASIAEESGAAVSALETPTPVEKRVKPESANELLSQMTLDEKIYQMLFVTPESLTDIGQVIRAGDKTKASLEAYPVGGIIYFSSNIEDREQVISMIRNTQSYSKIPLFIGVDEEGGRVARIGNHANMGMPPIEAMQNVGKAKDEKRAYEVGHLLGSSLHDLGFNVDFAPVADLLINPNNTEIGDRSFGNDPKTVSTMVENVVKGLEEKKVSAVLKHFPGHGSTQTDSHTGKSESARSLDELKENEFLPFRAGIEAGADFVLISHMTLPNATEKALPASLSKEVMTDMLRGELEFDGIIITDSFSMGAITQEYALSDAIIMSIDAGADIILMPPSVKEAHDAIATAVKEGKISESRIDESVRRILDLKIKKGLF